jgi:mediator of RNA polymerase II transcription subunit 7
MAGEDDDVPNAVFTEQMPAPPSFWRQFTDANVERVARLKEADEPIPTELEALVPPPVPADGKYQCFGAPFNVSHNDIHQNCCGEANLLQIYQLLPSLEEQSQERLYPVSATVDNAQDQSDGSKTVPAWTLDRAFELKKIARSMLLNYLELIGIISQDPTAAHIKIDHLTTLFLNAHHIINEYRPHQARETLILMAEERIARMKAEIESVKEMKAKVESLSANLFSSPLGEEINELKPNQKAIDSQDLVEATWNELNEELGT